MQFAIHVKTKVQPGGKIELELPQASVGEDVDVFVVLPTSKSEQSHLSVIDILDNIHLRRQVERSTEAIDRELQAERDSWDN